MSDAPLHGLTSDQALRLRCLELAAAEHSLDEVERDAAVIERARRYADFVLGTSDAEIVRAARDLAEKVR